MGLFKVTANKRRRIRDGIATADYVITSSAATIGVTSVVAYAMAPVISTVFHIPYGKIADTFVRAVTLATGYLVADAVIANDAVGVYLDNRSEEFADDITSLLFDEEATE